MRGQALTIASPTIFRTNRAGNSQGLTIRNNSSASSVLSQNSPLYDGLHCALWPCEARDPRYAEQFFSECARQGATICGAGKDASDAVEFLWRKLSAAAELSWRPWKHREIAVCPLFLLMLWRSAYTQRQEQHGLSAAGKRSLPGSGYFSCPMRCARCRGRIE